MEKIRWKRQDSTFRTLNNLEFQLHIDFTTNILETIVPSRYFQMPFENYEKVNVFEYNSENAYFFAFKVK